MAQFNITAEEHASLSALLKMSDVAAYVEHDAALQRIQQHLKQTNFNIRQCAHCGCEFEAANPRKTTCSDKCRQALSRSNRPPALYAVGQRVEVRKGPDRGHSFVVTRVSYTSRGVWFYTKADGLGWRESELAPAKSQSGRDCDQ